MEIKCECGFTSDKALFVENEPWTCSSCNKSWVCLLSVTLTEPGLWKELPPFERPVRNRSDLADMFHRIEIQSDQELVAEIHLPEMALERTGLLNETTLWNAAVKPSRGQTVRLISKRGIILDGTWTNA